MEYAEAICLVATSVCFGFLCYSLLLFLRKRPEIQIITAKTLKNADKDLLAFLLSYLLPIAVENRSGYNDLVLPVVSCLLLLVVYQSELYYVNPLLGMVGYHFYEVATTEGTSAILITKRHPQHVRDPFRVTRVSPHVFLEVAFDESVT